MAASKSLKTGAAVRPPGHMLWPTAAALLGASTALAFASWTPGGLAFEPDFARRWPTFIGPAALAAAFVLHTLRQRRELESLQGRMHDLAAREAGFQARFGELSFLFDISTQLQLRLDLPSMLDLAAQRLLSCLDATQSSVMLFDESHGMLEVKAAAGVDLPLVRGARVAPGEGIAGHVYTTGESLLITPEVIRERFAQHQKRARSIGTALCVPMRFQDGPIGVISVTRTHGESFEPSHVKMLEAFAEHCAATVVKTHHHHQMLRHVRVAA